MIICFDLETTGLDKYADEIIEIALVKFDEKNFKIIDSLSTFVNPGIKIPEIISNITNIYDTDVKNAPFLDDIKEELLEFIGDNPLLGHNIFFDRDFFIEKSIDISNNLLVDTFFLANFLNFENLSLNLELLAKHYNIGFSGAHRALNDVYATINLFEKLLENFAKKTIKQKELVYFILNNSKDKNVIYLKNILFKDNAKIKTINFEQFEKTLLTKIKKYSNKNDSKISKKIILDNIVDIFKTFGGLETRKNQEKMMLKVFNNLTNEEKLVIEAPTGLGKSFAYLLPSILFSINTGQKVFISTNTKTLQDQLFCKDLKFLSKQLGYDFTYTKIKGKKNYISLKGFFSEVFLGDFNYEKTTFLLKITLWLYKTEFGELDELNYYGKEFYFLREINGEFLFNLEKKDNYNKYEFLFKARQNVINSNIIIINHSLLFSDIKGKNSILGNIENLVIDEAHNIEDSITSSLRKKLTLNNIEDIFSKIETILIKNNISKIKFLNKKESLINNISLIFEYCLSYLNEKTTDNAYYKNCLILSDFFENFDFKEIIKKIILEFISIIDFLSVIQEYDFSKYKLIIEEFLDILQVVLLRVEENYIKIIGYDKNNGVSIEYTLLNPGNYLETNLYNKLNSILFTSATLKIGDNFDYIKKILSLDNFNFLSFKSDFDYKKQSTLFIPNDLGSYKFDTGKINDFLYDFYSIVGGNTLTLFTSFNSIKNTYTSLNQKLKNKNINLYAQSIGGSKIKLLEFYLSSPNNSILLGTDSFWQGIDISGDNLKYLIIYKFPFLIPNDPIFISRSKMFKDPFLDYSVAKAIIKLKQGFGRLIRSKKDKGMILLLDNRIINTKWGNNFYKAFPYDINIKIGNSKQFLSILKNN